VHDFFDVLGLPSNAPVSEIRRVCARRLRRSHPDFRVDCHRSAIDRAGHDRAPVHEAVPRDIAVDFVDMTSLVERIETSFFTSEP
jgi:hypothetical protein